LRRPARVFVFAHRTILAAIGWMAVNAVELESVARLGIDEHRSGRPASQRTRAAGSQGSGVFRDCPLVS
jgi:hypothetical protein